MVVQRQTRLTPDAHGRCFPPGSGGDNGLDTHASARPSQAGARRSGVETLAPREEQRDCVRCTASAAPLRVVQLDRERRIDPGGRPLVRREAEAGSLGFSAPRDAQLAPGVEARSLLEYVGVHEGLPAGLDVRVAVAVARLGGVPDRDAHDPIAVVGVEHVGPHKPWRELGRSPGVLEVLPRSGLDRAGGHPEVVVHLSSLRGRVDVVCCRAGKIGLQPRRGGVALSPIIEDPRILLYSRIRKSPFFAASRRHGVAMYSVYNHMYHPRHYGDPVEEYWQLLNGVTLWDVGVERQVEITGSDAFALANMLVPRDLNKCAVGQCKYVFITAPDGGIINDPILLRLDED